MSDLEKLKRHLIKPIALEIENEDGAKDVFYFKPLNIEQQAIMFEVSKKVKPKEGELPNMDRESVREMSDLFVDLVMSSLDGIDKESAYQFVSDNFDQLMDKIDKLVPQSKNVEQVALIKKKIEERKVQ